MPRTKQLDVVSVHLTVFVSCNPAGNNIHATLSTPVFLDAPAPLGYYPRSQNSRQGIASAS